MLVAGVSRLPQATALRHFPSGLALPSSWTTLSTSPYSHPPPPPPANVILTTDKDDKVDNKYKLVNSFFENNGDEGNEGDEGYEGVHLDLAAHAIHAFCDPYWDGSIMEVYGYAEEAGIALAQAVSSVQSDYVSCGNAFWCVYGNGNEGDEGNEGSLQW